MTEKEKSSKRFLVIYCIAIVAFAVALIGLAAYSQVRSEREADRLLTAETSAIDSKTRLDAVMTENARLKNEIEELTKTNAELIEAKTLDENRIAASQKLSELLGYKIRKKNSSFKTALADFKAAGYYEYLSENDKKLYDSIK